MYSVQESGNDCSLYLLVWFRFLRAVGALSALVPVLPAFMKPAFRDIA